MTTFKSIHSYHKISPISLLCWNICMSIKKSNPKKHKAMLKDLMKLEEDKYYPKKKGKNDIIVKSKR